MILDRILQHKRLEIAECRRRVPLETLMARCQNQASDSMRRCFRQALRSGHPAALIAEIKKASPSRGVICRDFDPERIANSYEQAGAAAISVLTDRRFFGGELDHLRQVHTRVRLPVLRKDFILDCYQVYEAKAAGAAAVLLIVAALPQAQLLELLTLARALDMAALVEVHTERELEVVDEHGRGSFPVPGQPNRFYKAAVVGEGVMPTAATIAALKDMGYQGYLSIEHGGHIPGKEGLARAFHTLQQLLQG
jgi:indole-3-glycerol phosphate synthase